MASPWKKFSVRWVSSLALALITFASARAADESGSFYINEALVHYIRPENGRQRKGATVTARFGTDGITICDPNRASEGAEQVFRRIYERAI